MKGIDWIGSSYRDLSELPEEARRCFGFALYLAQSGGKHPDVKPLSGFHCAGVLDVVEDHDGDTYRAV
jgi:phage-related protein